jgi:hypothetical protein
MLQSSTAIVDGVMRGSGLSSLSASGGYSTFTQATVPLPSPAASFFASPEQAPLSITARLEGKPMSVKIFNDEMTNKFGAYDDRRSSR